MYAGQKLLLSGATMGRSEGSNPDDNRREFVDCYLPEVIAQVTEWSALGVSDVQ